MPSFHVKNASLISKILKYLTPAFSLSGVLLSLFFAQKDGYSHWSRRLLYFTAQSNIWISVTFLLIAFLPASKKEKRSRWLETYKNRIYLCKYVFTVSITITGLVFCLLLAPFSDENYRPWTLSNFLTHVVTPVLAVLDFILDKYPIRLTSKHVFASVLPPLFYLIFAAILSFLHTDFGRGVSYPYFFLNYRSPAGFFGFSNERPFLAGSFYWIVLLTLIVLCLGAFYARLKGQKGK